MYIDRVRNINALFGIELINLMQRLQGIDPIAYWNYIVQNIHNDEFALIIAWDDNGLHGALHVNAPWDVVPGEAYIFFTVTDSTMTREEMKKFQDKAELYMKEHGATRWAMDTERNPRAVERKYGPFKHIHRLVKEL